MAIVEIYSSFKIHLNLPVSDSLDLQTIEVFSDLAFIRCLILCRLLSHGLLPATLEPIVIFRGVNYLDSIPYL